MILALILLALAFPIKAEPNSEGNWTNYIGHNMSFDYPAEWKITENPTGVTVGEDRIFALSITMHKEECGPLSHQSKLLDLLFMMQSKTVDGTPDGEPINQYGENEIGPYSKRIQTYKNPTQSLSCEIQGFTQKNATVAFVKTLWKPQDPIMAEITPEMDRLMESFVVILPENASESAVRA